MTADTEVFSLHEFIEIRGHGEIVHRPKFVGDIDPAINKPTRIVASYTFFEPIPCGLKNCHQPHKRGYLIETTDGNETNIGWKCGTNHFGVEFTLLRNRYDRAERIHRHKTRLKEVLMESNEVSARADSLIEMDKGGRWLTRCLATFGRAYPFPIVHALKEKARRNDFNLYIERERTKEEFEAAIAANPGVKVDTLRFVQELVGQLRGLSIFEQPVTAVPAFDIKRKLQELAALDLDSLTPRKLSEWYTWANSIEDSLIELQMLIEEGQKFFQQDNLDRLQYLTTDPRILDQLSRTTWDYDAADVAVKKPKKTKKWKKMWREKTSQDL